MSQSTYTTKANGGASEAPGAARKLQVRFEETEATLQAIRQGEVDALVVRGPHGEQVYALNGAEHPYRVMVEAMNEGAVILTSEGTIFYSNRSFAVLLKVPLEELVGSRLSRFVAAEDLDDYEELTQQAQAQAGSSRGEVRLQGANGSPIPIQLSISSLDLKGERCACAVITDLTTSVSLSASAPPRQRAWAWGCASDFSLSKPAPSAPGQHSVRGQAQSFSARWPSPIQTNYINEREPTVIIIDDDVSFRRSTEQLVCSAGFRVQTYATGADFLGRARPQAPACVVLDVRLPRLSGLDLQKELAREGTSIPLIFITRHADIPTSVQAMKAGAVEFLIKPPRPQDLLDAIAQAIEQDRTSLEYQSVLARFRGYYELLTRRERQVMALVVSGLLNKQVGAALGTTEKTIKFHRAHVMQKMRAQSLADLVRIADHLGAI